MDRRDYDMIDKKKFAMSLYAIKEAVKADLWTDGDVIDLRSRMMFKQFTEEDAKKFITKLSFYGYDPNVLYEEYKETKKITI